MSRQPPEAVRSWSAQDAPNREQLDFYIHAMRSSIVPIYVRGADPHGFDFEASTAQLGPLGVIRLAAGANHCGRGKSELAGSSERSFNLLMALDCCYGFCHRGDMGMRPGDLALHFSEYPFELSFDSSFLFVNLAIPVDWMRIWLPDPQVLVGRRIAAGSGWGRALSGFVSVLSPAYVATASVPQSLLLDQLGSLLMLAAGEVQGTLEPVSRAERSTQQKIEDLIAQRAQDQNLTAGMVADSAGISVRTLHRVLAVDGQTFGGLLIGARVDCALRMLRSPSFNRLTVAEIGRRAGFSDASHFSRAVRRRCGQTPNEIRSGSGHRRG